MTKKKPVEPKLSAREKLAREKARTIADRYLPDPKAAEGSGPWAAWCLEHIEKLEGQLHQVQADLALAKTALHDAQTAPPPRQEVQKLTAKEFAFVQEYLIDRNGTQAAIRAKYSEKTAAQIAYENLRKPHIARAIEDLIKERNDRIQWDADKMLGALSTEANADIADLYDENNCFKPVREWPLVWRTGLLTGVETQELWEGTGKDRERIGEVVKVKFTERTKIKELLGKHTDVQAFKEKVEHAVAEPLQQLYQQLAGTGIRPSAQHMPGVVAPAAVPDQAPKQNAIRPQSEGPAMEPTP